MTTQSAVAQNPTETEPKIPVVSRNPTEMQSENPVSEAVRSELKDWEDAVEDYSSTSVFVNSKPIREELVRNAVKFLSHPNVRGSAVSHRRSFLEKKGLTKEEIDEAFRIVPDPPYAVLATQPTATTNLDTQLKATLTSQSKGANASPPPFGFYCSQALFAVGILTISGAGTIVILKNAIVPRLKSWIRKVVFEEEEVLVKRSLAEETAAAAKAAAIAAADVARVTQEMLASKNEERRCFEKVMNLVKFQVQEMKAMSISLRKLEGQDNRVPALTSRSSYTNGVAKFDSQSAKPLSQPASVEPSVAPHPKSYMEIMAMIQRGEKPSNIREINDLPPNPNQPVSKPSLTPRPKPWEVSQFQNGSTPLLRPQKFGFGFMSSIQENGRANKLNGNITSMFSGVPRPGSSAVAQRWRSSPQAPPVLLRDDLEEMMKEYEAGGGAGEGIVVVDTSSDMQKENQI